MRDLSSGLSPPSRRKLRRMSPVVDHSNLFHAALVKVHDVAKNGTRDNQSWQDVLEIVDGALEQARKIDRAEDQQTSSLRTRPTDTKEAPFAGAFCIAYLSASRGPPRTPRRSRRLGLLTHSKINVVPECD